jgi:hypothetical protein
MHSLFIVVDVHVAVEGCHVTATMGSLVLLSSYKIFRAAVNNQNVTKFSCNVPDIFVSF